jgi:hypothetical protein
MDSNEIVDYVDCMKEAMLKKLAEKGESYTFETKGRIMWGMVRAFTNKEDSPYLKIIDFSGMLSPFSKELGELTLPQWAWDDIKVRARAIIVYAEENNRTLTPIVKQHLDNIIADRIPYGYTIETEEEQLEI